MGRCESPCLRDRTSVPVLGTVSVVVTPTVETRGRYGAGGKRWSYGPCHTRGLPELPDTRVTVREIPHRSPTFTGPCSRPGTIRRDHRPLVTRRSPSTSNSLCVCPCLFSVGTSSPSARRCLVHALLWSSIGTRVESAKTRGVRVLGCSGKSKVQETKTRQVFLDRKETEGVLSGDSSRKVDFGG